MKDVKKIFLLLLLFIFSGIYAEGQWHWGPEAGLNMSNIRQTNGDLNNLAYGARGGAVFDYEINDKFYFQPSAFFSMMGCNTPASNTFFYGQTIANPSIAEVLYYVHVPLNLLFKVGLGRGKFFMGGGPYLSLGIAGTYQYAKYFNGTQYVAATNEAIKFGSDSASTKPFDFGADVNFGYEWEKGLVLRAGFSYGLVNISNVNGATENNTCMFVSLAWLINNDRY